MTATDNTTTVQHREQLRARINAARDTNPDLARELTNQLLEVVADEFADLPRRPRLPRRQPPPQRMRTRARYDHCPDCQGPAGAYRHGRCNTCASWRRQGRIRTPADREPATRHCSNCRRQLTTGQPRRHGRCEPCFRHWTRNGAERPTQATR